MYRLACSARLIRLEFSPGSSLDIVNYKLRVTDTRDKELFRFELADCLKDPKNSVKKSVAVLVKYLKSGAPQNIASAQDEAERYFAESQFLARFRNFQSAHQKLDSAIALNPGKLQYRLTELMLNRQQMSFGRVPQMISLITKNMELIQDIETQFPGSKKICYPKYFDWNAVMNMAAGMQPDEMVKIAKLAARYREKFLKWERDKFLKFNLKDGIKTAKEWRYYIEYCVLSGMYEYIWDPDKWCQVNYKNSVDIIKASKQLYKKDPALANKCRPADMFHNVLKIYSCGRINRRNPGYKAAIENMFRNSEEYISLAGQHPDKYARCRALQCDLIRKTILNNFNDSDFKDQFRQFCIDRSRIFGGKKMAGRSDNFLLMYFGSNSRYARLMSEVIQEKTVIPTSKSEKDSHYSIKELTNIMQSLTTPEKQAEKFLELLPHIRKYATPSLSTYTVADFFRRTLHKIRINSRGRNALVFTRLQKEINKDFDIKELCELESIIMPEKNKRIQPKVIFSNYAFHKNKLFFSVCKYNFVRQNNPLRYFCQFSWRVGEMDVKTGQSKFLTKWSKWREQPVFSPLRVAPSFAIMDEIAVNGYGDQILVFSLNGGDIREINELPGKKVMSIAVMNGRIYAFTGEVKNRKAREMLLFSCNMSGGDRRIHISTSRDDKKNQLDHSEPLMVTTMFGDEKRKRLVFTGVAFNSSLSRIEGLWEYVPEQDRCKKLFSKKYRSIRSKNIKINNKIFFSMYKNFCIYDLDKDKGEIFFSTETPDAKHYLKMTRHYGGEVAYDGPFFARDNQMWLYVSSSLRLITFPEIGNSPMLFLPEVYENSLFPFPDGKSVIVAGPRKILKITPK